MSRGSFWITGDPVATDGGSTFRGPMYVEWERSESGPASSPVVLVHGGGGQGTDYLQTPDGRSGWAPLLVDRGFDVYVVDRPGHGRSSHHPVMGPLAPPWPIEVLREIFIGAPDGPLPPNTRWPVGDDPSSDAFAQFAASQGPLLADASVMHELERDRLVGLLERIGPAVLVAHSAGGPGAFLAADARPDLVRAFVAVETIGPPFLGQPQTGMTLPWGLAAAPMRWEPPADSAADLEVRVIEEGPVPKALQAEPARTLPNLAQVPIAIVTSQASPFRRFDTCLRDFLDQAGCTSTLLRLEDFGITGNGHGMMLETNNTDVLDVITGWLADNGRPDVDR